LEDRLHQQLGAQLPRLRKFAWALTRTWHDADDLVQTTYERALSRLAQWQPGTRLDSWMFRIMHTTWLNEVQARSVRARYTAEALQERAESDGVQTAESRLMLGEVEQRILDLPESERAVLVLVCVGELTYKEAAEVLDLPIGTVMSRLARARLNLVRSLGDVRQCSDAVLRMHAN
jgi:RNA polymerase sigma-70 factor, ECF subfamily